MNEEHRKKLEQMKAKLQLKSGHEQDFEHAKEWWRLASDEEKMVVWDAIQKFINADEAQQFAINPITLGVMARLAQFGFCSIALSIVEQQEAEQHGEG